MENKEEDIFQDGYDGNEYIEDEYNVSGGEKNDDLYEGIQGDVKFLRQEQLLSERDTLIQEAQDNLSLSRDEAILALSYYKWSMEYLNQIWFDDTENAKKLCGITLTDFAVKQLKSLNAPSNGNFCLICYDEKTSENEEEFTSLSCGHVFCNGCWKEYLEEKSTKFSSLLETKCPQQGCTCKVFESIFYKFLTEEETLSRLKKGIIKDYIENNKEIKYCPNPKCDYCIRSSNVPKDVTCVCKTSFCFKCNQDSHRPCPCEMYKKWTDKLGGDGGNCDDLWIKANTKECPHCHQRIEKSHGCNYMKCDKAAGGCGKAFCK
ncbi:MAG: hypothetical protein MJ252_29155 [archaeon]|nr:hypothetical protein [archaeon]